MSLASSVRRAVKSAAHAARGVEVDVIHKSDISRTASGKVTYGSTVTRRAIVEPTIGVFRDVNSIEQVSKATITFLSFVAVDPSDELTLPDGTTGPILRITNGLAVPTCGACLTEVLLG